MKKFKQTIKYNIMEKAIEILLEAFVNYLKGFNIQTAEQYKQVRNALAKKDVFKTDAEKNFLTLLVKLIANNRKDDCIRLIGLVKYSVCVYKWGSKRSYESYCKKFTDYLEVLLNSIAKSNKQIIEKIASACTIPTQLSQRPCPLSNTEEDWLRTAFAKRTVYLHEQLMTKFTSRLGSQDRISGNKVWLPLSYIAKLYKKAGNKDFRDWLRKLAESIFVHYEDENKKIKSVQFKAQQVFLVFEENENNKGTYDVYVALSANNKCYRAYTPTGEGNTKVRMTVKNISDIAIDHVKPIDQTLRDLQKERKIPNLEKVSESFRKMKSLSDKKFEKELLDELYNELKEDKDCKGNDGICRLTDELNRIKNDGVLRLMVSDYNSKKSNSSTYDRIIKNEEGYFGLLGEAFLGEDSKKIYLYQHLNEQNALTRASFEKKEGTEVKISKDIINYI